MLNSNEVEPEIQKATLEITRLREELSSVQRENLQLKVYIDVFLY